MVEPRGRHILSKGSGINEERMNNDVQNGKDHFVQVYWRPGCPHCDRLLRALSTGKVDVILHNIWEDDDAREYVRAHNNGNETVPTVAYNGRVLTNPAPTEVLRLVSDS